MNTGASILIAIFEFCAVTLFFLLIIAAIHRLAIRVVAGFWASIWMIVLCVIIGMFASFIMSIAILLIVRASLLTSNELGVAKFVVSLSVISAIFGVLIRYPNGDVLGFWRGLLSYLLAGVFWIIIGLIVVIAVIAVVGKKPVEDAWQKQKVAMAQMKAMQASKNPQSIAFPWGNFKIPLPSPTPDDTAAAVPGSNTSLPGTRFYLKEPITVHVAYGNIIIPAKTEVTLIEQTGDSCRVEFNNNVYTITRDNLTTQP